MLNNRGVKCIEKHLRMHNTINLEEDELRQQNPVSEQKSEAITDTDLNIVQSSQNQTFCFYSDVYYHVSARFYALHCCHVIG